MRSQARGKNISQVELNITKFGVWLYVNHQEYFLPHDEFPFFKKATLNDIYNLKLIHGTHLCLS